MNYAIYQVKLNDDTLGKAFAPLSRIDFVDPTIYEKVYEGYDGNDDLEWLFTLFNVDKPYNYHGRSMSVSDVIEVKESEHEELQNGFYYCDDIGFKKIDFDKSLIKF